MFFHPIFPRTFLSPDMFFNQFYSSSLEFFIIKPFIFKIIFHPKIIFVTHNFSSKFNFFSFRNFSINKFHHNFLLFHNFFFRYKLCFISTKMYDNFFCNTHCFITIFQIKKKNFSSKFFVVTSIFYHKTYSS